MSQRPNEALRLQVFERASYCCEYCYSQFRYSSDPFNAEHIVPKSKGGLTDLSNLAAACFGCNGKKWQTTESVDSLTGKFARLYHPRRDRWEDHFRWSHDFKFLIGLTPTGRVTVELLDLNREGVVNLRVLLRIHNLHPPKPIND